MCFHYVASQASTILLRAFNSLVQGTPALVSRFHVLAYKPPEGEAVSGLLKWFSNVGYQIKLFSTMRCLKIETHVLEMCSDLTYRCLVMDLFHCAGSQLVCVVTLIC